MTFYEALSPKERLAFRTFFHRGPVKYSTSQRAANSAYRLIKCYLTETEIRKISVARVHATLCNESRREFDFVCGEIRKRLGLPRQ